MKPILHILALVCTVTFACAAQPGQKVPNLSKILPGASLPSTAGKVVLVDFWASWCGPCKASFPVLNRLHEKYGSKGLVIIGIGVDDDALKFEAFAKKMSAKFPLVHDSSHKAAAVFNPSSMPSSYVIDRKGVIRHVHTGFHRNRSEAEYTAEIEALLGGG